jgi:hypothetical protein
VEGNQLYVEGGLKPLASKCLVAEMNTQTTANQQKPTYHESGLTTPTESDASFLNAVGDRSMLSYPQLWHESTVFAHTDFPFAEFVMCMY